MAAWEAARTGVKEAVFSLEQYVSLEQSKAFSQAVESAYCQWPADFVCFHAEDLGFKLSLFKLERRACGKRMKNLPVNQCNIITI